MLCSGECNYVKSAYCQPGCVSSGVITELGCGVRWAGASSEDCYWKAGMVLALFGLVFKCVYTPFLMFLLFSRLQFFPPNVSFCHAACLVCESMRCWCIDNVG